MIAPGGLCPQLTHTNYGSCTAKVMSFTLHFSAPYMIYIIGVSCPLAQKLVVRWMH